MATGKELIYKSEARAAILHENPSLVYCIDRIECVDAIEVRCKDCKYYDTKELECTIKFDSDGERLAMDAQHYCSDGKRRDNGV